MNPRHQPPRGVPAWFVTFGDMMTLLLCFFVLLLSFSTTDPAMYKDVSGSLHEALGVQREDATYDTPMGTDPVSRDFRPTFTVDVVQEKLKSAVKLELIKGEIEIESSQDRVILRLNDALTFAPGKPDLSDEARRILDKVRPVVETVPGKLLVEGHTDDTAIKNPLYPSNWGLSAARAAAVVVFLLEPGTISQQRIAAIGYGDSLPLVPNDTPEHRQKNRRVELVFMQPPQPDELDSKAITNRGVREQEILPPPTTQGTQP